MLITLSSVRPKRVQLVIGGDARAQTVAITGERQIIIESDQIESIRRMNEADGVAVPCTLIRTRSGDQHQVADTPAQILARITLAKQRQTSGRVA